MRPTPFSFRAVPTPSRENDLMFWDEPITDGERTHSLLSPLPSFLRAIGPNTIHIRSIVLGGTDTSIAAIHLLTALPLTITHLPNLIYLQLLVNIKYVDWDDPFAPDPTDDSAMANGPLEPMYSALQQFIRRVYWLEEFQYEGKHRFVEDDALEMLKEVEEIVEDRAWENLEKVENRRWKKTDGHWRLVSPPSAPQYPRDSSPGLTVPTLLRWRQGAEKHTEKAVERRGHKQSLATLSQLVLAPNELDEEHIDAIINIAIKQVLLQVRQVDRTDEHSSSMQSDTRRGSDYVQATAGEDGRQNIQRRRQMNL
ncbi:MAG: hypothetical protein LQ350_007107 [Teloschistes chrysophthalmus]|nr:MAG: hypothetical protein LQ350_007107 [Niorma chrysophthalma]